MDCELELTKVNRLKVAGAFQKNKRVDYSIDCVIEGQMEKAFVDSLAQPTGDRSLDWPLAGSGRSGI